MRVVVSGGGTGGHIYPALALIKEMKRINSDVEILYVGTEKGLESEIVTREQIPFKSIPITGFKRSISLENIKTVYRFLSGTRKMKSLLREFKPDVVIGTGGYVCGPVVYAAAKLKIPTVVHEQNSVPGLTNKFLSKYVDKVAICFEEAKHFFPSQKVVLTGNPRASEVMNVDASAGRRSLSLNEHQKTVLIVGGSRGARPINEAFLTIIGKLKHKSYQIVYVTGTVHYDRIMEQMKKHDHPQNVTIKPFIHNMPDVLGAVDLIVARAGATTLAEITALGLPSILIPSPYVTNNHQEKNAQSLANNNAAIVLKETEMSGDLLLEEIDHILTSEDKWMQMSTSSKELGLPNAARHLYEVLDELTKNGS
ncbi:undecaprenyldiphospho-muramoylpentapeptide beta-N-acetylglucosaminyltransferase [Halalkalibacter sp. APA_J-10(15)]|uniref:undecaprenyldiphospho-muramoylpentapeptide beta-N-acetylglucosaminyltransferase n=1 Tax=Halalkalibacter sp. APA_J-10(15) TaxID=2933805 RepID=UPI001FF52E12|nr:undecaprenyldiphospho-muramoylpentapeptide beta-N-acetylglucosaminyltransferase [Halalkalibacter sp. APA_J-10(15)]MCK0470664.1 undecaprenyldiphospho-muramoylpentapeptide beta-N-acetylglucosaminyltransferase [Halalkalibacter sp. APA_J-10(15)]